MIIISIITLFPNMFKEILINGIINKAIKKKIVHIFLLNPRNFSKNKRNRVDNKIYGGGPGMLMMFEPLLLTLNFAKKISSISCTVIYLSPQGKKWNNKYISKFIKKKHIIFICGRYEGIDERFIKTQVHEEWSIGDYVLTGGELPAMVIIDSILRRIPGVIKKESYENESFFLGLLDYPSYTKPKIIKNLKVPNILLSGNHENIKKWKLKESIKRTFIKRPDIFKYKDLNKEEKKILNYLKKNNKIYKNLKGNK